MKNTLVALSSIAVLASCVSVEKSRFSKQQVLDKPCLYTYIKDDDGRYSIAVDHNPGEASGFATGKFDAALTIEVTADHRTQTVLVDVASDEVRKPIPSLKPIVTLSVTSCVAYRLPIPS